MTTALDVIQGALSLTNAVGVDQTLTSRETSDCLAVFNDLIEQWSIDGMMVYSLSNQSFSTVAGTATYTIGLGATWNVERPTSITMNAICTYQGVNFVVPSITQEEYNGIALPTQQQPIVSRYLYVNEFPYGIVTLWPVPSQVVTMTFSLDRNLSGAATAATVMSFPPGYNKAFKYNLAIDLAPIFGKTASDVVRQQATQSMADVKRSNRTSAVARYYSAIAPRWNGGWYTGY